MKKETLLLIDGHSMAFRAFYAIRPESLVTQSGKYTNAVVGFANTLLKLLDTHKPTYVAVAFDLPGGTFRTREYSAYKAGRAATPVEFIGQIELIQRLLDTLGITWLTLADYEADDIIATLATQGTAAAIPVVIASGDKDSYQLVNEYVSVSYPTKDGMKLMTPQAVLEKTYVLPELYSDLAAIVGEQADNLPGVPLVGPKTAAKWLHEYGSLAGIIENADKLTGKTGANFRASISQVLQNRKLNQLERHLTALPDFHTLEVQGLSLTPFYKLCEELEVNTLRNKILQQIPLRAGETSQEVELSTRSDNAGRTVKLATDKLPLSEFLQVSTSNWSIAVAGNTQPGRSSLTQLAIAQTDGTVFVLEPEALSAEDITELKDWLQNTEVSKIVHSYKDVMHALSAQNLPLAGVVRDLELDLYLLHPDLRNYSLPYMLQRYFLPELPDGNSDGSLGINLAGELVDSQYLAHCAVRILDLADLLAPEISAQVPETALCALELAVAEQLVHMEQTGIAVSDTGLFELQQRFAAQVDSAKQTAHQAIGDESVNLASPKQLQHVLFERLNLPKTKKIKSGYTTNAEALTDLMHKLEFKEDTQSVQGYEFLVALKRHRDSTKLLQSVDGLIKAVLTDGRIHTTYQQTVAATGRLSSTEPNLQNIHARTVEGQQIREVFVPGADYDLLLTADYSQIEMRLMAHLSQDAELISAFQAGADLHNYVAARVFGVAEEAVSAAQRTKTKAMSYGLVYGLSAFGLSAQLNITVGEAKALMDDYFTKFGKVKDYLDSLVENARRVGYTETILGRRRYLPDLLSDNRVLREAAERMALNAPIQGSAADVIKVAMVKVARALQNAQLQSRILLQVHDELVLEVKREELTRVQEIVIREMENAVALRVPLAVGVGVGENWRLAAH